MMNPCTRPTLAIFWCIYWLKCKLKWFLIKIYAAYI
jgi:hypothetical protein